MVVERVADDPTDNDACSAHPHHVEACTTTTERRVGLGADVQTYAVARVEVVPGTLGRRSRVSRWDGESSLASAQRSSLGRPWKVGVGKKGATMGERELGGDVQPVGGGRPGEGDNVEEVADVRMVAVGTKGLGSTQKVGSKK
jgi:hypothetical protein